jgi:mannose-6-phosphate isomerase-like protein (cupin superfamily)
MQIIENRQYAEIVKACERFERDRRVESLASLIPRARLYVYGFRSLVGPLEVIRASISRVQERFQGEPRWYLKQVLDQLDQLEILRQLEVPNDFRAITVHFALHHKILRSVKANLQRVCTVSTFELSGILRNFTRAVQSVTGSNGLYMTNWKEFEDWKVLHIPDIRVEVVKLVYANRHSINLGTASSNLSAHKHRETSEIHFSLEPSGGDEIVGHYRIPVAEPFAVPIRPGTWHGAEQNETSRHHRILFLTGSPRLLGWGIVNDRATTKSSKLPLKSLGQEQIQKTGGVLLERAIQDIERRTTSKALEKELIGSSSSGGLTLSVIGIPDSWSTRSEDTINLVVRGAGEVAVLMNKTKVREGDVFAIPFGITYKLKNKGRRPLVLLRCLLEDPRIATRRVAH